MCRLGSACKGTDFPLGTLTESDLWPGELSGKGRAISHHVGEMAAVCAVCLSQSWDRPENKNTSWF